MGLKALNISILLCLVHGLYVGLAGQKKKFLKLHPARPTYRPVTSQLETAEKLLLAEGQDLHWRGEVAVAL